MEKQQSVNRLLSFIESNTKYNSLYWYPLNYVSEDIHVTAYKLDSLYADNKICLLEDIFKRCNIQTVYTFQADSLSIFKDDNIIELIYEKDGSGYNFPWYVETFYYDESKQWMIYVSHEGTITFTGIKITETAKEIIPDKYLYLTDTL